MSNWQEILIKRHGNSFIFAVEELIKIIKPMRFSNLFRMLSGMIISAVAFNVSTMNANEIAEASQADSVPGAPVMTVVADADCRNSVKISIKLPVKDKSGNSVSEITGVRVYRANVLIKEIGAAGKSVISYEDSVPVMNKNYTYSSSAVNKYGEGAKASKTVYVGVAKPASPSKVSLEVDKGNRNKVRVTWTASALDANKRPLDGNTLSYTVELKDELLGTTVLKEGIKETCFDYEFKESGSRLVKFLVAAKNNVGISAFKASQSKVFLGDSYMSDYGESFAGGALKSYLSVEGDGTTLANKPVKDNVTDGVCASDNDNGHFTIKFAKTNTSGRLITNYMKIDKPEDTWVYLNLYKLENQLKQSYSIYACSDTAATKLAEGKMQDLPHCGWNPIGARLAGLQAGEYQIAFRFDCEDAGYVHVDKLKFQKSDKTDIMLGDIRAEYFVKEGMGTPLSATLTNFGTTAAGPVNIEVLRNGRVSGTVEIGNIESLKSETVRVCDTIPSGDDGVDVDYCLRAIYKGDCDGSNNTTATVRLVRKPSLLPPIRNLRGVSEEKVSLTWDAPDLDRLPMDELCEDFEKYNSYEDVSGMWSTIDADSTDVANFNVDGKTLPTGKHGFFIVDTREGVGTTMGFVTRGSGFKYPVSLYPGKANAKSDDWLVSPELNGCRQTVTYWMSSYYNYNIAYETYISKSGRSAGDFERLDSINHTPVASKWKRYDYDLPEGTKYFAIRSRHGDPFVTTPMTAPLLMIDDITYVPAGRGKGELKGYNVYRDGTLLTTVPVKECRFEESSVGEGKHEYKVSAVYDRGESSASALSLDVAGTDYIRDSRACGAYGGKGEVLIYNPGEERVVIYNLQGLMIKAMSEKEARMAVPVPRGVYIVGIGSLRFKIMVR